LEREDHGQVRISTRKCIFIILRVVRVGLRSHSNRICCYNLGVRVCNSRVVSSLKMKINKIA